MPWSFPRSPHIQFQPLSCAAAPVLLCRRKFLPNQRTPLMLRLFLGSKVNVVTLRPDQSFAIKEEYYRQVNASAVTSCYTVCQHNTLFRQLAVGGSLLYALHDQCVLSMLLDHQAQIKKLSTCLHVAFSLRAPSPKCCALPWIAGAGSEIVVPSSCCCSSRRKCTYFMP